MAAALRPDPPTGKTFKLATPYIASIPDWQERDISKLRVKVLTDVILTAVKDGTSTQGEDPFDGVPMRTVAEAFVSYGEDLWEKYLEDTAFAMVALFPIPQDSPTAHVLAVRGTGHVG